MCVFVLQTESKTDKDHSVTDAIRLVTQMRRFMSCAVAVQVSRRGLSQPYAQRVLCSTRRAA